MEFADRRQAGIRLGQKMKLRQLVRPLVLAIPRGGVEVGAAIAGELGAELDVVLARKVPAPSQPELAAGAVGEDGSVIWNEDVLQIMHLNEEDLAESRNRTLAEIKARRQRYRAIRPRADARGRSVIITDDGLATGATMLAALRDIKSRQPLELIMAVPVASTRSLNLARPMADSVYCLIDDPNFQAVGYYYTNFEQVSDAEVEKLLRGRAMPDIRGVRG
jgi:predicted phosphoribosyltransferase